MEPRHLLRFLSEHTLAPKHPRAATAHGPLDYLSVTLSCRSCSKTQESVLRDCLGILPSCSCGARFEADGIQELISRLAAIEAAGTPATSVFSARARSSVLLVEDDAASELLTVRVIDRCDVPCQVHVARDGRQALEFLGNPASPRVDLVLLDVCMPVLDGFGVLRHLRADETLHRLPVVMLSTTTEPSAVDEAFLLGANGYVAKGGNLARFREDITATLRFWLVTSLRPQPEPAQSNYYPDL